MAAPGEALPEFEGEPIEPDVEAHIVPAHVNFQGLFLTYLNIREGEPVQDSSLLKAYEQTLLADPNGMALRQAFDRITTYPSSDGLIAGVMHESYTNESNTFTREMIGLVKSILPDDFDESLLYDPDISDKPKAA